MAGTLIENSATRYCVGGGNLIENSACLRIAGWGTLLFGVNVPLWPTIDGCLVHGRSPAPFPAENIRNALSVLYLGLPCITPANRGISRNTTSMLAY